MTSDASWYYDPKSWWVKMLRFLNLIETEVVQVSLSGATMWATSFNNFYGMLTSHDPITVGGGIIANIAGLWAHTAKRGQTLAAKTETQ